MNAQLSSQDTRPHLLGEGSEGGYVEVWLGVDDGNLHHNYGHCDEENDHQPYHHRNVILSNNGLDMIFFTMVFSLTFL